MQLNWGIIGLGNIARKFAQDLILVKGNNLQAVCSRSAEKATAFANEFGAREYYNSISLLCGDDAVDIVYVATPHNLHYEQSIQAMRMGKHVLCEKPLAINRKQVLHMIEVAKEEGVFLMEAMWSRFVPTMEDIFGRINDGAIGQVNYIHADFSFYREVPVGHRMFNMALAGGALLDIGVYPLFLNYMILGQPDSVHAQAIKHQTGADLQTSISLKYPDAINNVVCGFNADSSMKAHIAGTKGYIILDKPWHESQEYVLHSMGTSVGVHLPKIGNGLSHEIIECYDCIQNGQIQSLKWSHRNSIDLVAITDEVRKQIKLTYPAE